MSPKGFPITVVALDLVKTRAFYDGVLGFKPVVADTKTIEEGSHLRHKLFDVGGGQLIADAGANRGLGVPARFYHFAFEADSSTALAQKRDELRGEGVETTDIVDHGSAQSIYLKDPNRLSLEYCCLVGNWPEPGALMHSGFTLPRAALELTDTLGKSAIGWRQNQNGSLTMTRIAHCCCGSLRAEVTGEPAFVCACHCTECQRRSGSPFGVSTYFAKEQVRTEGPSKVYLRGSDSGRKIEIHFCPDCGSSVFCYAEFDSGFIGIAFGAFADPSMPPPTLSVWETTRHPWVTFDHQLDRFRVQPEIDDRDLEQLIQGVANGRTSIA